MTAEPPSEPPESSAAPDERGEGAAHADPASIDLEARPRETRPQGMVPGRERRRLKIERGFMRVVATGGIIGIAVILGAVLTSQNVAGWIIGLAVGLTSVTLAALLWSSRQL